MSLFFVVLAFLLAVANAAKENWVVAGVLALIAWAGCFLLAEVWIEAARTGRNDN